MIKETNKANYEIIHTFKVENIKVDKENVKITGEACMNGFQHEAFIMLVCTIQHLTEIINGIDNREFFIPANIYKTLKENTFNLHSFKVSAEDENTWEIYNFSMVVFEIENLIDGKYNEPVSAIYQLDRLVDEGPGIASEKFEGLNLDNIRHEIEFFVSMYRLSQTLENLGYHKEDALRMLNMENEVLVDFAEKVYDRVGG